MQSMYLCLISWLIITDHSAFIFLSVILNLSFRASYNSLESLLIRIDKNLDDKQHSLNTDVMCLDTRSMLKTGDKSGLPNETNRNIVLTRMEKEIPLES